MSDSVAVPEHDPLSVKCPSCLAPSGEPCRVDNPQLAEYGHADRRERARVADVERGTCGLCGQVMLRLTDPEDVWHPADVEKACPPEPATEPYDAQGWFDFFNSGKRTGRPGAEHFIPDKETSEPQPDDDEAAPADTD